MLPHSPPLVILCTQLHVSAKHADLRIDDDGQQPDDEDKAKEVVEEAQPHGRHSKVQLDEHGPEGQDTCSQANSTRLVMPAWLGAGAASEWVGHSHGCRLHAATAPGQASHMSQEMHRR